MLSVSRARGVSLVELLIVLAVLGVAAGALSRIASRQQRHYRALAARALALGQLREGSELLAAELASIAPGAGDIYDGEMGVASIAFRSALGTYVLCAYPRGGSREIDVIRFRPTGGAGAPGADDSALGRPASGDSLWIHDPGRDIGESDDGWSAHIVTSVAGSRGRCAPARDSGDVALDRLRVAPAPSRTLAPHAPARLFRRVRYALYQSSDGAWYLGFADCRPLVRNPACAPMQPVSGPYLASAGARAPGAGGLTLEYLDRDGAPTDDRLAVAAVEITLRAAAPSAEGKADTVVLGRVIALRNAPP